MAGLALPGSHTPLFVWQPLSYLRTRTMMSLVLLSARRKGLGNLDGRTDKWIMNMGPRI